MHRHGIKASELVKQLRQLIRQYGDRECFAGGTDYPEGVSGAYIKERGDAYTPEGAFVIN